MKLPYVKNETLERIGKTISAGSIRLDPAKGLGSSDRGVWLRASRP
jgi:hypothetical protein